jgi:hypothetical protein
MPLQAVRLLLAVGQRSRSRGVRLTVTAIAKRFLVCGIVLLLICPQA